MLFVFSHPELPVKRAVLNGFGDVVAGDFLRASQAGDGAGDFRGSSTFSVE
jgi:hypothetical protein